MQKAQKKNSCSSKGTLDKDETSPPLKQHERLQHLKHFRPEPHKKTFFKGATSLTMGIEGSLNLKDETARELVKESFHAVGEVIPEQTFE